MFKSKPFYYLVDKLDADAAEILRKALTAIPGIENVKVSVNRGMVEIGAKRDMADQVRIACEVAGALYRTRIQR